MWFAGRGMYCHLGIDAIELLDQGRRQGFLGGGFGNNLSLLHGIEPVAVEGGEVQVVNGGERCDAETTHQFQHVQLVPHVEVIGRLIEDEQPRSLS